jgi:hypothetical protein
MKVLNVFRQVNLLILEGIDTNSGQCLITRCLRSCNFVNWLGRLDKLGQISSFSICKLRNLQTDPGKDLMGLSKSSKYLRCVKPFSAKSCKELVSNARRGVFDSNEPNFTKRALFNSRKVRKDSTFLKGIVL